MTWFDIGFFVVIAFSVLISVVRGAVREILALASWVIAFFGAQYYALDVAPYLPAAIPNESLRVLAAFLIVFLVLLLLMSLVTIAISGLVRSAGLGIGDRILGSVFGLVRGVAIAVVIVLMAGFTTLPRNPDWRHAMFSAPLEALANTVKVWLPYDLQKRIRYD
jgi:membrane protein required for colicin V production